MKTYLASSVVFLICLTPYSQSAKNKPVRLAEQLSYLHLNIENDNLALLLQALNHLSARPVPVAAELGVLHEAALRNEVLKLLHRHVVVVDAVLLAGAHIARRVRDGRRKGVGMRILQHLVERALADARGAGDDDGTPVLWEGSCCAVSPWIPDNSCATGDTRLTGCHCVGSVGQWAK